MSSLFTLASLLPGACGTCATINGDGDGSTPLRYRRGKVRRPLLYALIVAVGILAAGCAGGGDDVLLTGDCEYLTSSEEKGSGAGLGSVQLKTIAGSGIGSSPGVAIMNALTSAINQLDDANVSFVRARSVLAAELDSTMNWETFDMSLVSDFARSVTGGAVSGLCVSSLRRAWDSDSDAYIWTADAVSRISSYVAQSGVAPPRVMVAAVRVAASQYAVGDRFVSAEEIASLLSRDLRSKISATSDYVLVDRTYTDEIDREQVLINSGRVNRREIARIGQMAAADIVVIPEIISLDYGVKTRELRTSGRTLRWYDGGMEISFLVMDIVTGEVTSEKSISKQFPGTEPTTLGIGIDAMSVVNKGISEAATGFAKELLSSATPVYVVNIDESRVTVSSGKELLSVGDRLIAYGVGQELFHPVSKESLGKEEVMIGEVIIDQVAEQLSYGTITLKQEHESALDSFELIRLEISLEGQPRLQ